MSSLAIDDPLQMRFLVLFYGGPQLSRQKQKSRVKSKSLASKAKRSPQKQNARCKSKTLAAKAKRSPQKQNARRKSKEAF